MALKLNSSGGGSVTLDAPVTANNYTLTAPASSGTIATTDGANTTFTSITDSGNLTFTGTGNRITGDFSNATIANRVAFQTSTTNAGTVLTVIPNGTGSAAQLNLESDVNQANGVSFQILANTGGTECRLQSGIRGTGTYLPMTFYTGGSERMRIDTSGNLLVGTTSAATPSTTGYISTANTFGFKNRIINGAMMIDQRNAGASVTPTSYTLDRWIGVQSGATSKYSVQQNAGSVTPPAQFSKYLGVTSLSAYTVTTNDYYQIKQSIEGSNVYDLAYGTASAATITVSFWVRSSLTGNFGLVVSWGSSGGNQRTYPILYSISSSNTWEYKSIVIPGDTTAAAGGFETGTGIGLQLRFSLGGGTANAGPSGSWATANYQTVVGDTSVVGTNGATFYITGVQLEKGSTATSFDYRPYGTELSLCERYFEVFNITTSMPFPCLVYAANIVPVGMLRHRQQKRASPTITFNAGGARVVFPSNIGGSAGTLTSAYQNTDVFQVAASTTISTASAGWIDNFTAYSSAEL